MSVRQTSGMVNARSAKCHICGMSVKGAGMEWKK